jgi:hypothetical protein
MSGGLIGPEYDSQIRETILTVRGKRLKSTEMDSTAQQLAASRFPDHAVILDSALVAATHALTGASSCLATICKWSVADEEYVETSIQITVWNHSESKSYDDDTFGIARFIDGHYLFFGDCAGMTDREEA